MQVTKRDGSKESLDISKIHGHVAWACTGLKASQSEIETGAHILFYDGIRTADIQKALIKSAADLTDIQSPDYTYVAARLLLQTIYKEVMGGGIHYPHLRDYIERGIDLGLLDARLGHFDLDALNIEISTERDFEFTYLGIQTLADRYLQRYYMGSESVIIEMPQHFWMRVAMGLALRDMQHSGTDAATHWAKQYYHVLSRLEFVSSTPTLFNSGTPHSQMSSCYLLTVNDSVWEAHPDVPQGIGIFASITEAALLSKYAGGIGIDWSRVRPTGGHIKGTNGASSGVMPYLKICNDTAIAVNQCFAPDTLIRVPDGVKRIADIQVGDFVLGERGEYRQVYDALSYDQKDPMVALKTKHSLEPLTVTSGHPIFAIKGVAREQSVQRTLEQITSGRHTVEWVEAGKLEKGDYVAQVIPTEITPVADFTEEDARLYGIMLGDGHCSVKPMRDSGGNDVFAKEWGVTGGSPAKDNMLDFVKKYLVGNGIKYGISTQEDSKAVQIKWSYGGKQQERDEGGKFLKSVNCLPFDHDDLYDAEGNKRIAARFAHLPLGHALALVRGLIESDGCVSRDKEITFSNTSRALIEGLRYQMLRLGVPTAGKKIANASSGFGAISMKPCWVVRIPAVTELAQALDIPAVTKLNWLRLGNMVFSRVLSVENVEPVSMVHDLKVDGDHTYSTTSALAHNGGKRNGAIAVYLEPWHADFPEFCDLKKQSGDDRRRAHDIFPVAWIPDLFMERINSNGEWSFFGHPYHEELHGLYGDAFKTRYEELERAGKAVRSMRAMELWKKIVTSLAQTGAPWITFKDECNRRNTQDHVGNVNSSNLCCMTADQRVVTDEGILTVGELYESGRQNLVAGRLGGISKASEMLLPRPNAPIVKIVTKEGYEHKVTPDHRVWVRGKGWVEAQDLKAGDCLELQQTFMFGPGGVSDILPEWQDGVVPDYAWRGDREVVRRYLLEAITRCDAVKLESGWALKHRNVEYLRDLQILFTAAGCVTHRAQMEESHGTLYTETPSRDGLCKSLGIARFSHLEPQPNEDAYCLTVDSEDHAWTVNGLITHNTEITLPSSDTETAVCNLGSINLSRVSTEEDLERVIPIAMRMLDNVIDVNFYPSEKARRSNLKNRPVGLGVMGLAELLVQRGIDWESQESLDFQDALFGHISYHAIKASVELAKERGAYETFAGSKWSKGILPIDTARGVMPSDVLRLTQGLDWHGLRTDIMQCGMRNSYTMAIAPTATIANIAGTTQGIEPTYRRVYIKENKSGYFKVVDPSLRHGRPDLCKEAFEVDQVWLIKAAAVRQRWIDQAQSLNLFRRQGVLGKELSEWYFLAWTLGLKTTYYLRNEVKKETGGIVYDSNTITLPKISTDSPILPEPEIVGAFCSGPDCESCQ